MPTMHEQIMAARYKLTQPEVAPYYARVAYSLKLVPTPGLGTLGVDKGLRLYYDPDIESKWSTEELVAVLAHECNHVLRDHSKRAPQDAQKDAKVAYQWNIAGDCEINDDLEDSGLTMPKRVRNQATGKDEGYVIPDDLPAPRGLTAEEYMRVIREQQKDDDGEGEGEGQPMSGHCGGTATGEGESPAEGSGVEPTSEGEADIIRRQSAKDISDHVKSRGSVPAGLKRWADEVLDATVPWEQELAALVRNTYAQARGKSDYSYRRPSFRRSGNNGFVLPSLVKPVPAISFIVDTSGSMGDKELAEGLAEISGVLKSQGAAQAVTVIATDAKVHEVKKIYNPRQIESLSGGGGTDMVKGIDRAR